MELQPWRKKAACKNIDPGIFYPSAEVDAQDGVDICMECSVRKECLDYAITYREKEGTWGGLSEWERRRIHRRMLTQRAAERKQAQLAQAWGE